MTVSDIFFGFWVPLWWEVGKVTTRPARYLARKGCKVTADLLDYTAESIHRRL